MNFQQNYKGYPRAGKSCCINVLVKKEMEMFVYGSIKYSKQMIVEYVYSVLLLVVFI